MNRIEQADDLLLKAASILDRDPTGTGSVALAQALASVASALLLRELVDISTMSIEIDPEDKERPW